MFRALSNFTRIKARAVCVHRLFVVRGDSRDVRLKKFVSFRKGHNEAISLKEMRAKICQLHDIKSEVGEEKSRKKRYGKLEVESGKAQVFEESPFVLDDTNDTEKMHSGNSNNKFIEKLKKRRSRPKNIKLTNFGFVRKDDDADRTITDNLNSRMKEYQSDDTQYHTAHQDIPLRSYVKELKPTDFSNTKDNSPAQTMAGGVREDSVNAFDEEYFNFSAVFPSEETIVKERSNNSSDRENPIKDGEAINPPKNLLRAVDGGGGGVNFFDEQYFNTEDSVAKSCKSEDLKAGEGDIGEGERLRGGLEAFVSRYVQEALTLENGRSTSLSSHGSFRNTENFSRDQVENKVKDKEAGTQRDKDTYTDKVSDVPSRRDLRREGENVNARDATTAYEAVVMMRKRKKKVELASLSNQAPDIEGMLEQDVVSLLCDSILFENDDIIAINKPYGLPSHGGPGVHKSVSSLTSELAKRRRSGRSSSSSSPSPPSSSSSPSPPEYHVVHRLDKETTGVMLLAKSTQMAEILRSKFKRRKVTKVYWAICKGVPNPSEGVVDIPMVEGMVGARYRMKLQPRVERENFEDEEDDHNVSYRKRSKDKGRDIQTDRDKHTVTHYRVLDHYDNASLVQCRPESGVKHQIRCHLSNALNTPILGDHKYSHFSKMAPQKLPSDILFKLGLRQAQVRHLNMQLHAKALVIPEFLPGGRNLHLSCRPPRQFLATLKALKLSIPK